MAEAPIMPFATDAYIGDTTHLTTIEHGAYLLLLIAMWRNGGWLPEDDRTLARYAKLSAGQWGRIKPVLWPFFMPRDGRIEQPKLTDMLEAVRRKSKSRSESARAKWRKTKEVAGADASSSQCERNAIQDPLTLSKYKDAEGVLSFSEILWTRGVAYLVQRGATERQARSLIGRWRKESGDRAVYDALALAAREAVTEPVAFITKALQPKPQPAEQKLDAWRIGDAQPVRPVPATWHRDAEANPGAADLPGVLASPEGTEPAGALPVGDADPGWRGGDVPPLRLVSGGEV